MAENYVWMNRDTGEIFTEKGAKKEWREEYTTAMIQRTAWSFPNSMSEFPKEIIIIWRVDYEPKRGGFRVCMEWRSMH